MQSKARNVSVSCFRSGYFVTDTHTQALINWLCSNFVKAFYHFNL